MKRFFKKGIAVVICACMLLGAVPLSVFAQTNDVQTDVENDVSMEATSAFGSMLTDAVDTQELDADSPYFISDLIFDGNNATASYYNELACTLVVAVYDEETNQMLSSAVIAVEAESLEATVSFSSLPENFVAKAFLLDENNASLCNPYTCNENTTAYKEFISKTVEDFDEDRVINLDESTTNNFVVLTDETVIVSGSDVVNVLESADIENDEYVFADIDEQIKNLRVGDTFYLDNGDAENITVIKIASISVEGDKAVIAADDTTLAEAFAYVKIDTEAQTDGMGYDGTNADEGVTYLGDVDYETGEAVAPANSGIMTMAVNIDESKPYSKLFEYEHEDITATVIFKATVSLKAHFGFDYGEITFTVDPSARLVVEVEEETHKEINFGKLPVLGIKGAAIYIEPTIVFDFSGKLTVSGELTFTLGFGWNSDSGFINKCKKPSFKPVVEVEVTFFIGFDLKPEFILIHENVASARLSGLVGAEIEALLTTELEEGHSCVSCLDGVVNGKVDISVTLSIVKTMPFGGEWNKNLYSKTVKIADFYFSVGHVSFGWEECPYKNGSSGGSSGGTGGDSGEGGSVDNGTSEANFYRIHFLDAEGEIFEEKWVKYGDVIEPPASTPYKEHYQFVGWGLPATMPAQELTVAPKFKRVKVMLIPKNDTCTTIIDRDNVTVDEYVDGKSVWYVYGLQERLSKTILLNNYIDVQGDGRIEIEYRQKDFGTMTGTGTVINVYDNVTDQLVESFYIVIFGDLNGDSAINALDYSIMEAELLNKVWSNNRYPVSYMVKAAALDGNGRVQPHDLSIIYSHVLGTLRIDQMTGCIYEGHIIDPFENGETIAFGSYPQSQNADGSFNVDPIEWRVLEYNNGELLLLSEKVLDSQPYHHSTHEEITWADCSLRTWLNNDFYNTAFNETEKALISTSYLVNEDNPVHGTEGGADTEDKIFLLSYSDSLNADYGFSTSVDSSDTRVATYSNYAENAELVISDGAACWWLRTPYSYTFSSYTVFSACCVNHIGTVFSDGIPVDDDRMGIRPALRINLNSTSASSSAETQAASYSLMRSGVQPITLDNGVDTLGFSYDKCIAGNTYTLLNVTDYGEGFELNSDNLYYINTVSADENGVVTASFIPKANAENSVILLIGDFGNGTETVVVDEWYNEYTVTWNTDGETVTQTVIEGAEIIAPENPEKVGYTFTGWTPSIPDTMPDYDLTFTATWAVNSYDAVFNANGGAWADGITELTVLTDYGAEIIAPENPEKTGYTFTGWTPSIPDTMPDYDLTFTATWAVNSYDAVFNANGGAWSDGATEMTVSTEYGAEIIAPEIPAKQGYIFSCWTPDIGIMDDVNGKKFTAEWVSATDTRYTIETYTMNTAGEYELSSQVLSGTTGETAEINPEIKTGFSLNTEKSVLSGIIAADNSLVLKVYIDRNIYTLTTVVDGVSAETKYYYGSMVPEPVTPSKSGYKFIKWDNEIPATMPDKNVTVTAIFDKSYTCPDCGNEILGENAINAHITAEARMKATVKIKNNSGSKTINYGETLKLTAIVTDKPADANIYWYVDGVKKGEGETFNVNFESGTKTVEVKLVDANGNVLKDAGENEISDSENVTIKAGFFQRIISFFKNLFRMNRIVIQSIFKNSL